LSPINAKYYLKSHNQSKILLIFESNIDFLSNHRRSIKKGLFKAKYSNYVETTRSTFQDQFSDRPLMILDAIYHGIGGDLRINLGSFDYPYLSRPHDSK